MPDNGGNIDFGPVGQGRVVTRFLYLNNESGTPTGVISAPLSNANFRYARDTGFPGYGGNCSTAGLGANQSCVIAIEFAAPASGTSSFNQPYSVTASEASSAGSVTLSAQVVDRAVLSIYDHSDQGERGILLGSTYLFGVTGVGNPSPLEHAFIVVNSGKTPATGLAGQAFSNNDFRFKNSSFPGGTPGSYSGKFRASFCRDSLQPGERCLVLVQATPQSGGVRSGSLGISYSDGWGGSAATRALSQVGTFQPWLVARKRSNDGGGPGTFIDFGEAAVSSSPVSRVIEVSNIGGSGASFGAPGFSGYFVMGSIPGGSQPPSCTGSLSFGQSCAYEAQFAAPSTAGIQTARSSIAFDYQGLPTHVPLILRGRAINQGVLSITSDLYGGGDDQPGPRFIDLGYAATSTVVKRVLYVKNTGNLSVSWSAPTLLQLSWAGIGAFPGNETGVFNHNDSGQTPYCSGSPLPPGSQCVIQIQQNIGVAQAVPILGRIVATGTFSGGTATAEAWVSATPTNLGILSISPANSGWFDDRKPFDFGTQGSAVYQDFVIRNSGNSGATLNPLIIGSSKFSFPGGFPGTNTDLWDGIQSISPCPSAPPYNIGPNSACVVRLQFSASGAMNAPYGAVLSLNPTNAIQTELRLGLFGVETTGMLFRVSQSPNLVDTCSGDSCNQYSWGTQNMSFTRPYYVVNHGAQTINTLNAWVASGTGFSVATPFDGSGTPESGIPACNSSLSPGSACVFRVRLDAATGFHSATIRVSGSGLQGDISVDAQATP